MGWPQLRGGGWRLTVWLIFPGDTGYWPLEQQVMVNYRVNDLDAMLERLRAAGAEVEHDLVEEQEFGRSGLGGRPRRQPLRALAAYVVSSGRGEPCRVTTQPS